MKRVILSTILALLLAVIPVATQAVEYGGIGGRPANPRADNPRSQSIFVYELEPGESYSDGVEVFNNTDQTRTIQIGSVDSSLASDGAFACAQEAEPKVDVGSWVELASRSVTIPAGDSQVVDFTITVPKDASVGEHSGCITIQDTQTERDPNQSGVVLSFRSAIRIAITIPGDIVKALSFGPITVSRSPTDASIYTVQPSLINAGNVSLDTALDIRFVSLFGLSNETKSASYPVLPGSSAKWNFDFNKPFWGGWYRADVTATYNNNVADGLGENSQNSQQTTSASSGFVFIEPSPLAAAIELFLLLLLTAIIFLLVRRIRHRRVVAKHWTHYTVQEGDSLQKIAKTKHTSWKKIATANKIKAPYHLEPGRRIKIPPTDPS